MTKAQQSTDLAEVETTAAVVTPTDRILAPLTLEDCSQFLYDTNYGGKPGKDFTAEGIKTIGLQNGISTGDVRVEFLNDEKTEALFYCTATDRNGDTSERVVKQSEKDNGRINPTWIEKGIARAERNAIKAQLPVQLFKVALQKAIAAGKAKESAIVEAQQALGVAWAERDDRLGNIDKSTFYAAAQAEYGDSEHWDADTWLLIRDDLQAHAQWGEALTLLGDRRCSYLYTGTLTIL